MGLHINELPEEVLAIALGYLKVRHRKNASLVCKKWLNASRSPSFYRTLTLEKGIFLDEPPLSLFSDNYGVFSVLKFVNIDEFSREWDWLWQKLGESIKEVVFVGCVGLDDLFFEAIMERMPKVEKIKIVGCNRLTGELLESSFSSVKILDISDVEIHSSHIENLLDSLPDLKRLDLGAYTYSEYSQAEFNRNFDPNAKSTAFGDWLQKVSALVPKATLSYDCDIVQRTDILLAEMAAVPNLEVVAISLSLDPTNWTAFHAFLEVKGLQVAKLSISNAQNLEKCQLELINQHCGNLQDLTMKYNSAFMTKAYPLEVLNNLKYLKNLSIDTNDEFMFRFLRQKVTSFPKLTSLTLSKLIIHPFNDQFELFLQSLPSLLELRIHNCALDQASLDIVLTACPRLEILTLCGSLTATEDLREAYLHLPNLEKLDLRDCLNVSDEVIKTFRWPELQALCLSYCLNGTVAVDSVDQMCSNCPTLNTLILDSCTAIHDDCVEVITARLPQLEQLSLENTKVTPKCLEYIEENCKDIKYVSISCEAPLDSKAAEVLFKKRILRMMAMVAMDNITSSLLLPTDALP